MKRQAGGLLLELIFALLILSTVSGGFWYWSQSLSTAAVVEGSLMLAQRQHQIAQQRWQAYQERQQRWRQSATIK
ncbi:hypothetical protein [Pseudidiomarina taiwanensis]|uniref:Uncharacterized protein n=1 Tax=Pseudidiomarina taiwanensis TaxID=337250 RepID=A0A432ZJR4_9GAMM|nr:hypothetical protein [Pseudidiomarina taiwanensis]RUO78257.1 hypothetical protein CWI83_04285 [Pseudidiomarina taiwanensis]